MEMESPARHEFDLDMGDGTVRRFAFGDVPPVRVMFAIKEHCEGDSDKFFSLTSRFWAFLEIVETEQLEEQWVAAPPPDSDRGPRVHDAVIYAASEMPLNWHGHFNTENFCRRVRELAQANPALN